MGADCDDSDGSDDGREFEMSRLHATDRTECGCKRNAGIYTI